MKSIRQLELQISTISHRINYLQGMLRSSKKKQISIILKEIQNLELKQKEFAKELKRLY
jgi:hypothetical protein